MTNHPALVFCIALCWLGQWQANAETPATKRMSVAFTTEKITLDGLLDEAAWAQTQALDNILQREPKQEVPATEQTEVKLLADKDNLYIGVTCYDSEPEKVVGTQMARDAALEIDDSVAILLDTFHDRRNAFYFATNPAGALIDGLIVENARTINFNWNGIWNVRAKRTAQGWSAEFAIPFKTLSFNPGQDDWGFNFSRIIIRKIEEDRWATPRLDVEFTQVSEAGEITGLAQVEQGIGLDLRPYALGRWTRDARGEQRWQGTVGGEVFYNITPGLRLTTTVNTDFAETEVDNRQINLTRFPLFFPEKRAFFLENAGVFDFGRSVVRQQEMIPFFSRRIGLLDGQEVPILAGTKLTGKAGRYDVGALAVRTRATPFTEAKNYFVARVKRNAFKQSFFGGIYTEGDPVNADSGRTLGADMRLATANFLGTKRNFAVDAYALKTTRTGLTGDDTSFGVIASYPNDRWWGYAEYRHVGKDFSPALGFVQRRAIDKFSYRTEFNPRPKKFLNVRQMFNEFMFTAYRRNDVGKVESWRLFTAPVNWEFNSGDRVEFNWVPTFERLFVPFEIADKVKLPAGDYRFTRFRAEIDTADKRPWQAFVTWWFGSYWSGRADEISAQLLFKFAPHFQAGITAEQTFGRLPQGNFVARVWALRADYAFSPFFTVANFLQYDNESRNLGWQSRVRWILRPGNDFFLVFNQGWEQVPLADVRGFRFRTAGSRLTGKLQYTFRF
ncbi:MAG TPA: DUF5916 domain-containing protein [Blastocatellia bacterium]|nr:DUF5916 domain-containing protein [Blastocatellia bacterium]